MMILEGVSAREFLNPAPLTKLCLDAVDFGVLFIDNTFKIVYANSVEREKNRNVVVDADIRNLPQFPTERSALTERAMRTRTLQEMSGCVIIEESGMRHLNIRVAPVLDDQSETVGVIEMTFDVEDLYQTNVKLERLNQEYENVIYALSHDLRSPLVSIEGFLRKLEKKHLDTREDDAMHCVERIRANVRMMNDFVNVLLDTSRIATGSLDMQEVDFNELVDTVVSHYSARAAEQGACIVRKGDFPKVYCDRIRILQVFSNLIGNALLHGKKTECLHIEVGCRHSTFWIKDNGPGIEPEFQSRLFEPFTQGERKGDEHFGMGLNIVSRIIQKHKGSIWIESVPKIGTTFYFTLLPDSQ